MLSSLQPACCKKGVQPFSATRSKSHARCTSFRHFEAAAAVAAPTRANQHRSSSANKCERRRFSTRARAQQKDGSSTSGPVSKYLEPGPYASSQLPPIKFLVGQGKTGPLDCTLRVFVPQGEQFAPSPSQRWPLVILSAGFLLHSDLYSSYGEELTSWGLAVALYDIPEIVDDVTMVSTLGCIIDTCLSDPRVSPYVDPRSLLLAGHSRGGKLSVLAAASDPRVKGVALLDPVDVTAMTPSGPGYPSALPAMRIACGPPRRLPALVVGAARNTDVIPADANYRRFVSSCPGPCWSLELLGAGHLQFLDSRVELLSMFVESGSTPDEAVRRVSRAALAAWARELAVPLARGEALSGQQVTERLQQASAALERAAPLSYGIKGFDYLGAPGSFLYGSTGSSGDAGSWTSGIASSGSGGSGGSSSGAGRAGAAAKDPAQSAGTRAGGPSASAAAGAAAAAAAGSAASTSGARTSGAAAGGSERTEAGGWSREKLLGMRARELKAILVERGVDCADCFEKEDLVKRILERC